ncbi:MAG: sulfoxide reductase heme-binding subunit YedZ [Proteobacteria bacterium]|nr:MAG: sulfoxide reductase heme-binding subunit YedZ [Pseudomonadota bacterium]
MARGRTLNAAAVAAGAAPAAWLAWRAAAGDLGANPIEAVEHATGGWALRFLLAALAVTPLRRLGLPALAPLRRTLGLVAFVWVCAHFLTWSVVDNGLDWAAIGEDIVERPYVTVGFAAFVLLIPLAATSNRAAMRALGRRWVTLHRLVYPAALLAVVHFLWLVKKDMTEPLVYAAALGALLAARFVGRGKR